MLYQHEGHIPAGMSHYRKDKNSWRASMVSPKDSGRCEDRSLEMNAPHARHSYLTL